MTRCERLKLVGALALMTLVADAQAARCVPIHDGTQYLDKPEELKGLLSPITIVYGMGEWWRPNREDDYAPALDLVQRWAAEANEKSDLTVIDIENWPSDSDIAARSTVGRFTDLVSAVRRSGRNGKIGLYGTIPGRSYWKALAGPGSEMYMEWQRSNSRMSDLAQAVDILFPSLYTFYDDLAGWKTYASENIREARRVAPGKPVMVFLWPQYHESTTSLKNAYLPREMWRSELDYASDIADGIVIWGGYKTPWAPQAGWWQETKSFIAKNCIRMPKAPTALMVQ